MQRTSNYGPGQRSGGKSMGMISSRLPWAAPNRLVCLSIKTTIMVCICLAAMCGAARAQVTGLATMSGTASDPTGAVIVGARVVVTNTETGVSHRSVTNHSGYFEISDLVNGTYNVTVTYPGFEKLLRKGITVLAAAHLDIPLQMRLGSDSVTVIVNGDASLLNKDSGSNGQVLTHHEMETEPVNSSNTMQFIEIAPGVQSQFSQTYSMGSTLGWNGVSKMGTAGLMGANEYSLDGAPNVGNTRGNAISLSSDEVGEMKIDVTGFDPAVGHTLGINVTQTIQNGTNGLHGSLRALYVNKHWAAMQHFQGLTYRYEQEKDGCTHGASTSSQCLLDEYTYGLPGTHENNDGFGIGGPVFIPKIYDGRNKLFWFTGYDNDVYQDTSVNSDTIPTVAERSGDFSALPTTTTNIPAGFTSDCPTGTAYYGQYQIYDPYTVTLDSSGIPRRSPVCGNVLPTSMNAQGSMVTLYNSLLPTPTNSSTTGSNYTFTAFQPQTFRQFVQRFDYAANDSNHIFVAWTRSHYTKMGHSFTVGDVGYSYEERWIDTGTMDWNHIFSAKTNIDVTFGASSYKSDCCQYPGYNNYKPSDLGLPSYADTYGENGMGNMLPEINVSNYQSIGNYDNAPQLYRVAALRANGVHVASKHTIRAGFEWRLQNYSQGQQGYTNGEYSFDNTYTQENDGADNTYSQSNYGLSYAAFLSGAISTSYVSLAASESMRTPYYAGYIGDTWRVTPKLTIIPGARFEWEAGPREKQNHLQTGWDSTASLPISSAANTAYTAALAGATAAQKAVLPTSLTIQGGPTYCGLNGAPCNQFNNNYRLLPRVAISYLVTEKTLIHGGFGLFWDTLNATNQGTPDSSVGGIGSVMLTNIWANLDGYSTSTSVSGSTDYGQTWASTISDPFPANSSGARYNTPIGSAAGSMYYAGSSDTFFPHDFVPTHTWRVVAGLQHQFSANTVLDVTYTGMHAWDIGLSKNMAPTPASFYSSSTQPNVASAALLSSTITNPFYLSNFSSLESSDPTQYNLISLRSYFTSKTISVANLVRNYPQMSGMSMYQNSGETNFNEIMATFDKRYTNGLSLNASLQVNRQHNRGYYANAYDAKPSWELSNNSAPYRLTVESTYMLPFGKGHRFANSGWEAKAFGNYQMAGTYEQSPGMLIAFSNAFYIGQSINKKHIMLKHPVVVNGLASGGQDYIQWLNIGDVTSTYDSTSQTCTNTGTGFVTNGSCTPDYNVRKFPPYVAGVREKGINDLQLSMQRSINLPGKVACDLRFEAFNVFNRQMYGTPDTGVTDSNFGKVTGDGSSNGSGLARWVQISMHVRF